MSFDEVSKKIKVEKPKEFHITPEELSELSFNVQNLKARQIEAEFWNISISNLQRKITKRLSLDGADIEIDWTQIFPDGILFSRKKVAQPQPKIEVKPVEANKNDNNPAKAAVS